MGTSSEKVDLLEAAFVEAREARFASAWLNLERAAATLGRDPLHPVADFLEPRVDQLPNGCSDVVLVLEAASATCAIVRWGVLVPAQEAPGPPLSGAESPGALEDRARVSLSLVRWTSSSAVCSVGAIGRALEFAEQVVEVVKPTRVIGLVGGAGFTARQLAEKLADHVEDVEVIADLGYLHEALRERAESLKVLAGIDALDWVTGRLDQIWAGRALAVGRAMRAADSKWSAPPSGPEQGTSADPRAALTELLIENAAHFEYERFSRNQWPISLGIFAAHGAQLRAASELLASTFSISQQRVLDRLVRLRLAAEHYIQQPPPVPEPETRAGENRALLLPVPEGALCDWKDQTNYAQLLGTACSTLPDYASYRSKALLGLLLDIAPMRVLEARLTAVGLESGLPASLRRVALEGEGMPTGSWEAIERELSCSRGLAALPSRWLVQTWAMALGLGLPNDIDVVDDAHLEAWAETNGVQGATRRARSAAAAHRASKRWPRRAMVLAGFAIVLPLLASFALQAGTNASVLDKDGICETAPGCEAPQHLAASARVEALEQLAGGWVRVRLGSSLDVVNLGMLEGFIYRPHLNPDSGTAERSLFPVAKASSLLAAADDAIADGDSLPVAGHMGSVVCVALRNGRMLGVPEEWLDMPPRSSSFAESTCDRGPHRLARIETPDPETPVRAHFDIPSRTKTTSPRRLDHGQAAVVLQADIPWLRIATGAPGSIEQVWVYAAYVRPSDHPEVGTYLVVRGEGSKVYERPSLSGYLLSLGTHPVVAVPTRNKGILRVLQPTGPTGFISTTNVSVLWTVREHES